MNNIKIELIYEIFVPECVQKALVLANCVRDIAPKITRVLVWTDVQHFEGFEAIVVVTPVDYFSRFEVEQMVFAHDVIGDSGFVADILAPHSP